MIYFIFIVAALLLIVAIMLFLRFPRFGSRPKSERLERIRQSPNYKNGQYIGLGWTGAGWASGIGLSLHYSLIRF